MSVSFTDQCLLYDPFLRGQRPVANYIRMISTLRSRKNKNADCLLRFVRGFPPPPTTASTPVNVAAAVDIFTDVRKFKVVAGCFFFLTTHMKGKR